MFLGMENFGAVVTKVDNGVNKQAQDVKRVSWPPFVTNGGFQIIPAGSVCPVVKIILGIIKIIIVFLIKV